MFPHKVNPLQLSGNKLLVQKTNKRITQLSPSLVNFYKDCDFRKRTKSAYSDKHTKNIANTSKQLKMMGQCPKNIIKDRDYKHERDKIGQQYGFPLRIHRNLKIMTKQFEKKKPTLKIIRNKPKQLKLTRAISVPHLSDNKLQITFRPSPQFNH